MEVGLAPNIMKCIDILSFDVIKDFPYNYDRIIQVSWKNGKKNYLVLLWKCVWNDVTWHFEISNCDLSSQAYLHLKKQIVEHYKAQFPNPKNIPVTLLLLKFNDSL
jgi:hypothetical protein